MTRSHRKRTVEAVLSASFLKHLESSSSAVPVSSNNTELFHQWRQHDSLDFHAFHPQEITQIRQALLSWYHQHRRKLPWRGDPPPWTGSTVDFIANSTTKKKKKKSTQTSLTSFFQSSGIDNNATTTNNNNNTTTTTITTAFPITPYGVWVSEIMLQQTRVEAVIPFWVQWMQSFPTVFDLASATPEQVNARWAGLGFYRRARYLHAGAQAVVAQYAVSDLVSDTTIIQWPTTVEAWQQLPGVGRYTASAICSICFHVPVPVVDGNVCRVLSRLRGICQHVKAPVFKDQYAWTLLQPFVEGTDEPGNVNQALMELGATYCAPAGTGVEEGDPLRDFYYSTRLIQPAVESNTVEIMSSMIQSSTCPLCAADGVEQVVQQWRECQVIPDMRVYGHKYLPMAPPQSAKRVQVLQVAALCNNNNQWLLVQRPPTGLLAGQWEFPSTCVWDSADMDSKKEKSKSIAKVKDPEPPKITASQKRQAWKTLMETLSMDTVSSVQTVGTLEHVFSHVKHIMNLQTGTVGEISEQCTTSDGRILRWMTLDDMKQVGITSGVKKILKAMEQHGTS